MARACKIQVKKLKELQAAMRSGASSVDPKAVTPILLAAVSIIRDKALENLRAIPGINLGGRLPLNGRTWYGSKAGQRHVEDVLTSMPGKSSKTASAFAKVWKKFAPQGIWLEDGHRIVGHKPNRTDTGKEVRPRPFFRPAVVSERVKVRREIRTGLQELLKKGFGFGKPGDATD